MIIFLSTLSIPVIGFVIGTCLHFIKMRRDNNSYFFAYSITEMLKNPIWFLSLTIQFILFFVFLYFYSNFLFIQGRSLLYTIILSIPIYYIYGVAVYGGLFWHLSMFALGNFSIHEWLKSEQRAMHFSFASLLSIFFCLWLFYTFVYRDKNQVDQMKP